MNTYALLVIINLVLEICMRNVTNFLQTYHLTMAVINFISYLYIIS